MRKLDFCKVLLITDMKDPIILVKSESCRPLDTPLHVNEMRKLDFCEFLRITEMGEMFRSVLLMMI